MTLLGPDYDLQERIESKERARMFILSILHEAYKSGNELQAEEFEAKLKAVDEEINQLQKYDIKLFC